MKASRAKLAAGGLPVDYKIGGLTMTCRGEMTPLRKRILAAQIADFNRTVRREWDTAADCRRYPDERVDAKQKRASTEYRAWCKANNRAPIWKWTPSVTTSIGASIIELCGDGISRLDRWLALCKKVPPLNGTPPPLPPPGVDRPQV